MPSAPPPPPHSFYTLLATFLAFPLHAPLTLLVLDAPFGKFAWDGSWLNVHGNTAWVVMEAVSPMTFLFNLDTARLSPRATLLTALYFVHYTHRSVVSPMFLAPKRAPLHVIVVAAGVFFNYLNATLLAHALVSFPPPGGWRFMAGIVIWALGFVGNAYHDEILHDLRRPAGQRLVSTPSDDPRDTAKGGRYRIPRGGLFALVSFPNYLCEWLEWSGFALAATPSMFIAVPTTYTVPLALPFGWRFPAYLLAAPWAFVLAEVTSMLPRAVRGHAWYRATFAEYPKNRRAAVPWLI